MDKSITTHGVDDVTDYEATIDRYIADLERIQCEMSKDEHEIKEMQLETRRMLAELLPAA